MSCLHELYFLHRCGVRGRTWAFPVSGNLEFLGRNSMCFMDYGGLHHYLTGWWLVMVIDFIVTSLKIVDDWLLMFGHVCMCVWMWCVCACVYLCMCVFMIICKFITKSTMTKSIHQFICTLINIFIVYTEVQFICTSCRVYLCMNLYL
jgi:hypothetical protein